ncbi:hypothetical protein BDQ17DRAFT_1252062, partial [Cyathus striatus]
MTSKIEDIDIALKYITAVRDADLDSSGMDPNDVLLLQDAAESAPNIDDPDLRLGLKMFLTTTLASQEIYTLNRDAILERYPDSKLPSFDKIKWHVKELSGIKPLENDMCINTCLAFTGPFSNLEHCPMCNESRYDPHSKKARQHFSTIPIGPQIQALYRSKDSAQMMKYRRTWTAEILSKL